MSDPEGREEGDSVAEKVVQVLTKNQTGQDPPENTAERMGGESNSDKGLSSVAPTSGDNMSDGLAASMSSDELFSLSDDKRSQVPRVNCAEKIIICLDASSETQSVSFQSRRKPKRSMFQLVQKAISIFLKTKSSMNPDHEFGILVLDDTASWCQHFAKNIELIRSVMDQLTPMEEDLPQEFFDMETLLNIVHENIELPQMSDLALPPPYVVRLLLVYSRSLCQPCMSDAAKQMLSSLLASPYFFFDVLYVHELPSENNHCEATYDLFCDLDEDEVGYMLEVSRSTTRLFDHMAALLAHPLQRPKQRDTSYRLTPEQTGETDL